VVDLAVTVWALALAVTTALFLGVVGVQALARVARRAVGADRRPAVALPAPRVAVEADRRVAV